MSLRQVADDTRLILGLFLAIHSRWTSWRMRLGSNPPPLQWRLEGASQSANVRISRRSCSWLIRQYDDLHPGVCWVETPLIKHSPELQSLSFFCSWLYHAERFWQTDLWISFFSPPFQVWFLCVCVCREVLIGNSRMSNVMPWLLRWHTYLSTHCVLFIEIKFSGPSGNWKLSHFFRSRTGILRYCPLEILLLNSRLPNRSSCSQFISKFIQKKNGNWTPCWHKVAFKIIQHFVFIFLF